MMAVVSTPELKAVAGAMWGGREAEAASTMGAWSFRQGLLASLLVHAMLALPFVAAWQKLPAPPQRDKLVVELFGLLAERQTEVTKMGEQAAPMPAPRPPPVAPQQPRPSKPVQRAAVASPVKAHDEERDKVVGENQPPPVAPTEPRMAGAAPENQVQQTIVHDDRELDAQRRYLAALKKAVKSKLSYPPEAHGVTGSLTIAFRLRADGSIEPGSLVVRSGSGSSILDEQALRTVRAVMPFEPPPKAMLIAFEIPFELVQKNSQDCC